MKKAMRKILYVFTILLVVSGVALAASHGGKHGKSGMGAAQGSGPQQQQMMQQKQYQQRKMKSEGEGKTNEALKIQERERVKQ